MTIKNIKAPLQIDANFFASLIIAIGILIRIPMIHLPFDYQGDIWRQTDTASIAHHFFTNGYKILYPQIYWGGNGPGYVEAEFQLYPFIVAIFYRFFGEYVWLGRMVSLIFTALTIICLYLLAKLILKPREAILALIIFSLSPLLLRYSASFMPEATVMCFYVGSLYFFTRWLDDRYSIWLYLAAVSTSLAILVKPTAIHIGVLFFLLAVRHFGWDVIKNKRVWLATLICLLPVVLYYWHARNIYIEYGNTFGVFSGGDSKFGNLFFWTSREFYFGVAKMEAKWVFTPFGSLIFLIGFYQTIKRHQLFLVFSVITIGLYFLILARYTGYYRGLQYHIYMVPYAALGIGVGIETIYTIGSRRLGGVVALAAILTVFVWTATLYSQMISPTEPKSILFCAEQIRKLISADEYVVISTFDYSVDYEYPSIPNNYQEPTLFYYSQRYGWSLPADWLNVNKLEELRKQGAHFFIILDREKYLLDSNPDIIDYLRVNTIQRGPGIENSCDIYQFRSQ